MKALLAVLVASVGILAVGCAAETKKKSDLPTTDLDADSSESTKSPRSSSDPAGEDADEAEETLGATDDRMPEADPTTPEIPEIPPATPAPTATTKDCNSSTSGHTSAAKLTFRKDGEYITVTKLTVLVTNKDSRNENDIDVWVTAPGGSEVKSFNSGDILKSGSTVEVKVPTTFALKPGAKVRIETNFDRAALSDPASSCTVQF